MSSIKPTFVEENAQWVVELRVENAPDVPKENTTLTTALRPSNLEVRYTLDGGAWRVYEVNVSGRPVLRDGTVSMTNMRKVHARYTDFTGSAKNSVLTTPQWVVDFVVQYNDPTTLPRKR